ncbi:monocyte differentiation antigen CD14 [Dryobates pubescens]|uniref:monocyte differentiation antigen CD14 n=1 Tax=Dryobates pubescens TaxID=118200 RepID=UPI0023BA0555|nr:monocyte differentiation antigen CD14 [Dryobates pubescens]
MEVAVLLLLLGLLEAEGRCFFNRTQEHCTCYNLSEESLGSIIQCLPATVVEFWGGELQRYVALPITDPDPSTIDMLGSLTVRKIVFGDLLVPEALLARVLRFFSYTQVQELAFESCTFEGQGDWQQMAGRELPILSLRFHQVSSAPLAGREQELRSLSRWLRELRELSLTACGVASLPCAIGSLFAALRSLDVAHNSLGDESLGSAFCPGAFPRLQALSLRHNRLRSYRAACQGLRLLPELQHLDLSHNKLLVDPTSSCRWPQSLRTFNLSSTGLDEVPAPLPRSLEVLDLSRNHLRAVDLSLGSLKKLFLSHNLLQAAPPLGQCPMLDTLTLGNNSLRELPWAEVKQLRELAAPGNPYDCSCSGAGGLQALAGRGRLGQGWPQDYVCQAPPGYRGVPVAAVPVSVLRCQPAAVIVPCLILALLGAAAAGCLLRARAGLALPCRAA